jgi:tRNA U34 5-methylaminomethyl-2-thiouridine-forming methyltransferase MnmC
MSDQKRFGEIIPTMDGSLTLRHPVHKQDYHSSEGAKFEANALYVDASGFKQALDTQENVVVLDVGMGLGYNACASIAAWLQSSGKARLELVSIEIESFLVESVATAKAPWQEKWDQDWLAGPLALKEIENNFYQALLKHPKTEIEAKWNVWIVDGASQLWSEGARKFQFVWQDPFTAELNPSMWSKEWFDRLNGLASPGAVLMTYSVARVVRDALMQGGWGVERIPTPGRKKHWLKASKGK